MLPRYANTHTESSRHRAGDRAAARAGPRGHPRGGRRGRRPSGDLLWLRATAAINKLIAILGLRLPETLADRYRLADQIPADQRPVVFVGPYEHHSNELPWRESIADVVTIDTDPDGQIDLTDLDRQLIRHADRPLRIGSFSAASNVTGILTDTAAVATLLHRHGALSLWDYGRCRPLRADQDDRVHAGTRRRQGRAVPVTPQVHRGPANSRRARVRRDLITIGSRPPPAAAPCIRGSHRAPLPRRPVAREEAGTPAIVESIRAGLVFALKQSVGTDVIAARERQLWQRVASRWEHDDGSRSSAAPGQAAVDREPAHPARRRWLHHNFIVALLNDLFGIQARGGCSCAGPYGHRLLAIDPAHSRASIARSAAAAKGSSRLGAGQPQLLHLRHRRRLPRRAIALIAQGGHRLLGDYHFDPGTACGAITPRR